MLEVAFEEAMRVEMKSLSGGSGGHVPLLSCRSEDSVHPR